MTYENRDSTLASNSVPVTSASHLGSTTIIDNLGDYMTNSITNVYKNQLSLFFASNAGDLAPIGNSLVIILLDVSSTHYAFPIGWAGRVYVGLNINPLGSKIEGSFTSLFDIDVNYVDDYFVLITCSFEGTAIFDCNIDLFK